MISTFLHKELTSSLDAQKSSGVCGGPRHKPRPDTCHLRRLLCQHTRLTESKHEARETLLEKAAAPRQRNRSGGGEAAAPDRRQIQYEAENSQHRDQDPESGNLTGRDQYG